MSSSFYENLLKATDNTQDITVEKYGTVTQVYDDNTCDVIEKSGEITHTKTPILNGLTLDDGQDVIIGFVENNLYNPFIIGVFGEYHDKSKQDKLIPGANITIIDNVISSTGGSGGGAYVEDTTLILTGARVEGTELIL